jgi:hypothetical protein
MIFINKKSLLLLLTILSLTACASQYAPLTTNSKYAGGYQELLLDEMLHNNETLTNYPSKNSQPTPKRYLLTYQGTTSDTKERISGFWQQRANELCPNGYNVESHLQTILYGTIRSPVNGRMENLGTQQPIDKGIIQYLD